MKRGVLAFAVVVSFVLLAASCATNNPGTPDGGTDAQVGPCGPGTAVMCAGVCVDVQSNAKNCGLCAKDCGSDLVCSHGTCATVCGGGTSRCVNDCVDLNADVNNCGGCGKPCPPANVCNKGVCALTCQAGLTDCTGDCVDVTQDDANCGGCGNACPGGQVCVASHCQATCQSGWTSCAVGDSGTTCADLQHDTSNCGSCGNQCQGGYFCSPKVGVGTCGLQCFGGTSLCGSACVDENIDNANCGSCGGACSGTCSGGHCCSSGQIYCGGCDTVTNCIKKTGGRISAGYGHVCAITLSGALKCWGYGYDGELGDGTTTSTSTSPVSVSGLSSNVTDVGVGDYHSCAVASGVAYCWGDDYYGEIGIGTDSTTYNTPQQVTAISGVLKIDGGGDHTCAVLSTQAVYCWGGNYSGEVGDGTSPTQQDSPVQLTGITSAIDVNAGLGYHACAMLSSGAATCWGDDTYGQCGDGMTATQNNTPVSVSSFSGGVALSLGYDHTCALVSGGTLKCWGYNYNGQLGDGTATNSDVPVTALISNVIAVAAAGTHTCALTSAGAVECWGDNTWGQLGDGTNTSNTSAVTAISSRAVAIAAGGDTYYGFTCAYMSDGTVKCWGYNGYGQLGNGSTTDSNTPVSVTGF